MARTRTFLTLAFSVALALLLTSCPTSTPPDDGDGPDLVTHTLTVQLVGNGTVESDPYGIDCPGTCHATLDEGATLTLHASPAVGHTFAGWAGDHDCADGVVTLARDTTCTALFHDATTPSHLLEVALIGQGSVTSTPAGIDCPAGACVALYSHGTVVTLTAIAGDGYAFDGWHGHDDCSDGQVTLASGVSCVAAFAPVGTDSHILDVTLLGGGTVTSTPVGVDCPSGTCVALYPHDTIVTLTPAPDPDHAFSGWSGDPDCSDGSLTMTSDRACTATFTPSVATYDLIVTVEGHGTVTSSPAGIRCGPTCQASFTDGTTVTLTPVPDGGHDFTGWSGDPDCSDGSLTMTSDRACTATFQKRGFTIIDGGWAWTSVALDHRGNAWGWGSNEYGQVGDGTTATITPLATAADMPDGITFVDISSGGFHTLALDQTGHAWAWGNNQYGQIGNQSLSSEHRRPTAVTMPGSATFVAVSAGGNYSLALDQNGHAWCWGENDHGQIGDKTYGDIRLVPNPVTMPSGVRFVAISAGGNHSLALDQNGRAWAWGNNDHGQVGDGTTGNIRAAPTNVRMPDDVTFRAIGAGGNHSLALDTNGHAWGWGQNAEGQVGDGTLDPIRWAPTHVTMPAAVTFTQVAGGCYHSLALDQNGHAWGWGLNMDGQIGDGTTNPTRWAPTHSEMPTGITFTQVAGGCYHSLALDGDRQAWGWGDNFLSQLGDGSWIDSDRPRTIPMP